MPGFVKKLTKRYVVICACHQLRNTITMSGMKYCQTTSLERIQELTRRIWVVQGGTSAGKTIAILIYVLNWAIEHPGKVCTVVSDTFPNLRTGAMRDFLDICRETNVIEVCTWNKTNSTLYLPNNSLIEFYSVDTMGAHGARRDLLYVNEANRISWDTFSQLEVRTRDQVIIDFNPVNEFWAHTELVNNPYRKDVDFIKLTYQDNEGLDDRTIEAIETRRGDGTSNWWRVYGLGEIGSLEGNVYEGWIKVDRINNLAKLRRYGVDFGYSPDPTAVVAVYEGEDGEIYLKQEICQTKLLTPDLIKQLKDIVIKDGDALFVCDNARPEIIAELQANGVRAIGCDKTPGEKKNGKKYNIELVQRRKVHYLESDKELEREYLTYAWRKKKSTGETLDEPEDGNDHCMDAIAYAIRDLERKPISYGGVRF